MAETSGERPLLLLDDLFDKLDARRVEQLIRLVSGERFGQIFITDCNPTRLRTILDNAGGDYALFAVRNGALVAERTPQAGELAAGTKAAGTPDNGTDPNAPEAAEAANERAEAASGSGGPDISDTVPEPAENEVDTTDSTEPSAAATPDSCPETMDTAAENPSENAAARPNTSEA